MKRLTFLSFIILSIVLLGACQREPEVTPTPGSDAPLPIPDEGTLLPDEPLTSDSIGVEDQSASVLISEVLTGADGANNHEFVELYNASETAIDLQDYSLWYLTREGQEETLLYSWQQTADIPGLGHFLLVHEGEAFGPLEDALFESSLFEGKGGLNLRNPAGEVIDRLGWGDAPEGYYAGSAVVDLLKGSSLERLPGGELGSGRNSNNNAADFSVRANPDPQNSGDPPAPLSDERLVISLDFPDAVPPGATFDIGINVENLGSETVGDVQVFLPVAEHFSVEASPAGTQGSDGLLIFPVASIGPKETASATLSLTAPMANVATLMRGYYADSDHLPRAYGELALLEMDGSAIPIKVARSLPEGSLVTVEGVVTMYPGGFFAGSSSAKIYLEDETGGVQIFADGGRFDVPLDIGDRARVTGVTELFRDSLEIIPLNNLTDIELVDKNGPAPIATEITIEQNEKDEAVLGKLNVIEGIATRIDEFSYHYEVDLIDEAGNQTLLYIEKDTGISDETLKIDGRYQVTGISEVVSNVRQLKPRLQSDIVEIFPPLLLLELSGPANVLPGQSVTITISAINHTDAPLTNVQITAVNPAGGRQEWLIPALEEGGASKSVAYLVDAPADAAGIYVVAGISAVADQWPNPAEAALYEAYVGDGVPIWVLQGDGSRSPLIGQRVTAVGQVTGAFPEMDGFFLQTLNPDDDLHTSDGIFVSFDNLSQQVKQGDLVEVTGRVREDAGQTILRVAMPQDIVVRSEENNGTVDPVRYDPPADPAEAALYNESLEGMLVAIDAPAIVVGPSNRYGEFILVYDRWDTDLVRRTDESDGFVIWVDDATFNSFDDQSKLPFVVARGDVVDHVLGPLAYTFGNYKIAPISEPSVRYEEHSAPSITGASDNQFAVATFNVENLFDTEVPHPEDLPRLTDEEYEQQLGKVAQTFIALGAPVVVALQEVENFGVLEDLADQQLLAEYSYAPALIEGNDSRGIDVGYLVRTDRATIEEFAILDAPNALFARPPLMLRMTVHLESGDQQVILLNNHFLSLSAGEAQTEPVRTDQAAWNAALLEQLAAEYPQAHLMVLGDLNSFYRTEPLITLQESGLKHAYEFFQSDELLPYTYIFEGSAQSLDHILMSEGLFEKLTLVEALHTNADFPIADPTDNSPRRVSDHDPLLVLFTFQ